MTNSSTDNQMTFTEPTRETLVAGRSDVLVVVVEKAAGTAATLAVKVGVSPGEVDVEQLREHLKSDGVIV